MAFPAALFLDRTACEAIACQAMSQFVHLHVHSSFSLLSGASSPQDLVSAAHARGMRALALTDTNGLYAAIPFYQAALAAGIRPILGVELHAPQGTAVLLARDLDGYRTLCRLITAKHLDATFNLPLALNNEGTEHIVVLSRHPALLRMLAPLHLGNVYVEIPVDTDPRPFSALADELRLPTAATNDVHFHNPHLKEVHRTLTAIRLITPVTSLKPEDTAPRAAWLKPPELVERELAAYPEAVGNAGRIADKCRLVLPLGTYHFPEFETPDGSPPGVTLRKLALEGLRRRYGAISPQAHERLERELAVIISMGYASYFLTVWDVVRFARERGIAWAGKGSAAASLVAYALGITDADPIRFNLYFERFLNPERKDPPDIDVDFCWRRRDKVIDYVLRRYGSERAAMICTYNRFGFRSALREVAKAHGLAPEEITALFRWAGDEVRRIFESGAAPDRRLTVRDAASPSIGHEPFRTILYTARAIRDHPRHLSIHAGGLVIAPTRLSDFVPIQRSGKGVPITQFDMHPIEDIGLVKIDLLGQRSLSVISDTVEGARRQHRVEVDVHHLPEDDAASAALLRQGRTIGCFQVESPGMRALLQKLQADNLPILVAAESIIRPGPADSGLMRAFIHRYLGLEKPQYAHPALAKLLGETFGVMLYQEDVLKVAQAIGGLTLGEADDLRRSMTKKRNYEGVASLRERFIAGALSRGFPNEVTEATWKQISSFAGYAFCKAHSAAYSVLSWQAVYLKAHFPALFLAAVLSNRGGFYAPGVYVEEARRIGLKILPPNLNAAETNCTAEGNVIRIGFSFVKSLTGRTIEQILRERRSSAFLSLSDFASRVRCTQREMQSLILCGGMDSFGLNRPQLMWQLETLSHTQKEQVRPAQPGLFTAVDQAPPPDVADYSLEDKVRYEIDALGFAVSAHPLAPMRPSLEKRGVMRAGSIPDHQDRIIRVAGRVVSTKHTTTTERGEEMFFLSLEDETALFEVVLFPHAYRRLRRILCRANAFVVTGKVQKDDGAWTLVAHSVEPLGAPDA